MADESSFLAACRGERTDRVPVWFMRQAGRSLPEYRQLRGDESILVTIRKPELAAELTMQPVRRYGVDAAILFSDIIVPVAAAGVDVDIVAGRGPVIAERFDSAADLDRLRPLEPERDLAHVAATVRLLTEELLVGDHAVPLIGFAGAPFTVASYLVEGGPTRTFARTKALMHGEPALWFSLMDRLADLALAFLSTQVASGARAVQLFDSWAGALSRRDYAEFALPATRRVLEGLAGLAIPRILFGVGTGELLEQMGGSGADVVGVDWRVRLQDARGRVGPLPALQGNLDPAVCLAPPPVYRAETARVLADGREAGGGHVFNLGHGVLPETDPAVLKEIVDLVHGGPAPS